MERRHRRAQRVLTMVLAVGLAGVLVKAAGLTSKYDAEMARLRGEWRVARQAEGLDPVRGAKALYDKYPTPELALCKTAVVAPGASAPLTCSGKFGPKTTFLTDHDQITLTPGAVSATSFAATTTVAADALPAFVRVFAYAPVSGAWSRHGAVVIGARPAFTFTASNGWTVTLTPDARTWLVDGETASLSYRAEYFTPGSATPFETMTGPLTVSASDRPGQTYTVSLQAGGTGTAMQEYQELVSKMADPAAFMKMSEKERAAFEKRMEEVGDRMTKEMEAMTANPEAMVEKQARFGCGAISITVEGGQASGSVSCGQKVGSLSLKGKRA